MSVGSIMEGPRKRSDGLWQSYLDVSALEGRGQAVSHTVDIFVLSTRSGLQVFPTSLST